MSQTSILSTKTLSEEQRQVFIDANFDILEQDFIEIKNIVIAETPTIEEVILEVIEYYTPESI